MTRIKCEFAGGIDTILYSVKANRSYSYECDRETLEKEYGGKTVYTSLSGLSGSGYLEPLTIHNDLIPFGYYRADTREKFTDKKIVGWTTRFDETIPIYGYAPIVSHHGISRNKPWVLSDDENKITFCSQWDVIRAIKNFSDEPRKPYKIRYWTSGGICMKRVFHLALNSWGGFGVNAQWFLDMPMAQGYANNLMENRDGMWSEENELFVEKTGIYKIFEKESWFHVNYLGYIDQMWAQNPLTLNEELIDGWTVYKGVTFRRKGLKIEAIYQNRGIEYDLIEWFEIPLDQIQSHVQSHLKD